SILNTHIPPTF
nr:immunoglobulin light chain junction region [Macaca mulatta]MOX55876.1 immunoglobulin light chain junction region [Macaca mulatta]MOX56243.1 immunoglobulin light chain junction region [Macaca mulatta]